MRIPFQSWGKAIRLASLTCLCLTGLWPRVATAQQEPIRPEEKFLLTLIARDSTSETIAYLPQRFSFGIPGRYPSERLILVKQRKKAYFLVNGSNRVYIPHPDDPVSGLQRIDNTRYTGHNFGLSAFIRKDSLFQFGGYGFWNVVDYFSYYDPSKQEWEYLRGTGGLHGSLTIYQFDSRQDKYYILYKYLIDRYRSDQPVELDSAYCYDFARKEWQNLGHINPVVGKYKRSFFSGRGWLSPYGVCVMDEDRLRLIDLPTNRMYPNKKKLDDTLNVIFNGLWYERSSYFPIQFGDTVYFFTDKPNEQRVPAFRFNLEHFDLSSREQVYTPVKQGSSYNGTMTQILLAGIPILALGIWLLTNYVRKKRPDPVKDPIPTEGPAPQEVEGHPELHGQSRAGLFLSLLSPLEKELVAEMTSVSQKNEMMEIQTINNILGVSKKDLSLQKNRRSVTISHINTVFQQVMRTEDPLIIREKDDFDKRSFRYSLNSNYVTMIAEHVQA